MNQFEHERTEDRRFQRALLLKWSAGFAALVLLVIGALWWSGSAIRYSADRVQGRGAANYQVSGRITDAATHQPIPWAAVTTDIKFGTQFFETSADASGQFLLMTLAEPHRLVVRANGYQDASVPVGRQWFSWLPRGSETRNVEMAPI